MSSQMPDVKVSGLQHNGRVHFEDNPEMKEDSEVNVNYEDNLKLVLNLENEFEDVNQESRKKKKKSKKQRKSLEIPENNNTMIAEKEDNTNSEERKRKRSKKHKAPMTDENEVNTSIANEDIGEPEIKKKKHKHKKKKKEELVSEDVEIKQEAVVIDDDDGGANAEVEEHQKADKKESVDSDEILVSSEKGKKWPKNDVLKLLISLENNLSNCADLKPEELWQRVQFDSYTPEDCKSMYTMAVKKIRKVRTMLEIVKDAIEILPTLSFDRRNHKSQTKPKPITPFKLYMESHYKKFSKKNPNLRQIDVLNMVSKQWLRLEDKKKLKYIVQALAGEKKYFDYVEEYRKLNPTFAPKSVLTKAEKKIIHKSTGLPEKPCCNSFGLFVKMSGHLLTDVKATERIKGLSKIFNELPPAVKEDYENRIRLEKEEYKEKVSNYISKLSPEERLLSINSKLVEEQKKYQKNTKLPSTVFALYYNEHKDSLPELSKYEKYKTLQGRWKMLPKIVQETYKLQREKMKKSLNTEAGKQKRLSIPTATATP